jgi:hypothetical protein
VTPDCTGPTHAGLKWLKRVGCKLQDTIKETYDPKMRYGTTECVVDPEVMVKILPMGYDRSTIFFRLCLPDLRQEDKLLAVVQMEANLSEW